MFCIVSIGITTAGAARNNSTAETRSSHAIRRSARTAASDIGEALMGHDRGQDAPLYEWTLRTLTLYHKETKKNTKITKR